MTATFEANRVCLAIDSLREMFSTGVDDDNEDREIWALELDAAGLSDMAASYRAWVFEKRIAELESAK